MTRNIERINSYSDSRFSPRVLRQHGAFLVDGEPYEVEIIGDASATVRGSDTQAYAELIEQFRFFAEHISVFYAQSGELIAEYAPVTRFLVKLSDIQPSQFVVDRDKLRAVESFACRPEDIVIPVQSYGERWISQDGHTRLLAAKKTGLDAVYAFIAQANEYILGFVEEARRRGVYSAYDLKEISHEEYKIEWDKFCDEFFERNKEDV